MKKALTALALLATTVLVGCSAGYSYSSEPDGWTVAKYEKRTQLKAAEEQKRKDQEELNLKKDELGLEKAAFNQPTDPATSRIHSCNDFGDGFSFINPTDLSRVSVFAHDVKQHVDAEDVFYFCATVRDGENLRHLIFAGFRESGGNGNEADNAKNRMLFFDAESGEFVRKTDIDLSALDQSILNKVTDSTTRGRTGIFKPTSMGQDSAAKDGVLTFMSSREETSTESVYDKIRVDLHSGNVETEEIKIEKHEGAVGRELVFIDGEYHTYDIISFVSREARFYRHRYRGVLRRISDGHEIELWNGKDRTEQPYQDLSIWRGNALYIIPMTTADPVLKFENGKVSKLESAVVKGKERYFVNVAIIKNRVVIMRRDPKDSGGALYRVIDATNDTIISETPHPIPEFATTIDGQRFYAKDKEAYDTSTSEVVTPNPKLEVKLLNWDPIFGQLVTIRLLDSDKVIIGSPK